MKIEIDAKTAKVVSKLTAINGTPPGQIIARALAKDEQYWQEYEEDKAAIERYRKTGEGMSQDDMHAKMDSMIMEIRRRQKQHRDNANNLPSGRN